MTAAASIPVLTPPKTYPACTDPGYVMTVTLGGSDYQVFVYTEGANGTKNYLPSTCNPQAFEKIRGLTWGLLNAHDSRRSSLNEKPVEMKAVNARGLNKADGTTVSHDFLIQPVSTLVADQMASAISLAGHPMQAAAVKAQDVWTTMEEIIRQEMERPTQPIQLGTATSTNPPISPLPPPSSTPSTPTPSSPLSMTPQSSQISAQNPQLNLTGPTSSSPPPMAPPSSQISTQNPQLIPSNSPESNSGVQLPPYRAPVTATDLNLRGFKWDQSDWYEQIPDRTKLRIITDILENHSPVGGIYEKVWKMFEVKVLNQPSSNILGLLAQEKTRLSIRCRALPSPILPTIRRETAQIIAAFHQGLEEEALQEKMLLLMEKEFERKEQLFDCIRQQAEVEGVVIENWDRRWAQYHYIENTHRFVQALTRWLDIN
jgi:hypothetical protein